MKDRLWQAVYDALLPLLSGADVVLAPRGDWPRFPCDSILYDDLIEIRDATVLVLHKGQMTSVAKAELRKISDEWQWVFANQVFIVLTRSEKIRSDVRRSRDIAHCRPLMRFLQSGALRRRRAKSYMSMFPKPGARRCGRP